MSESSDKKLPFYEDATPANSAQDSRRPYEPPRILKRRSLERATMLTAMGPMATAITVMG